MHDVVAAVVVAMCMIFANISYDNLLTFNYYEKKSDFFSSNSKRFGIFASLALIYFLFEKFVFCLNLVNLIPKFFLIKFVSAFFGSHFLVCCVPPF